MKNEVYERDVSTKVSVRSVAKSTLSMRIPTPDPINANTSQAKINCVELRVLSRKPAVHFCLNFPAFRSMFFLPVFLFLRCNHVRESCTDPKTAPVNPTHDNT